MAESQSTPLAQYTAFLARKRASIARRVYIYVLIDPFTDEIRYVGKSIRPKERLWNHCGEQSKTWRTNWIRQVLAAGKRPRLEVVEILDRDEDWRGAERRWIAHFKAQGVPLTNCTSGGDGVPDLPPEIRERMRQVWLGRKHRPETLAKMKANRKNWRHTPEHRQHMREIMTGRRITWIDTIARANEKLTAQQVREIRAALAAGVKQYTLAAQFGVDKGTISNIKRGISYAWVTDATQG